MGTIVLMSTIWTPLDRIQPKISAAHWPAWTQDAVAGLLLLSLLWGGWLVTSTSVTVTVDGVSESVRTHRRTVAPLLMDLGLVIHDQDRLSVALDHPLSGQPEIRVERAYPVRILADGRDLRVFSFGSTPTQLLQDAGISIDTYDQVVVDGRPVALTGPLAYAPAQVAAPTYDSGQAWANLDQAEPMQVRIYRAIPITVDDGDLPFTVRTTAQTVGQALRSAEIILYLGDKVQPSLGSPVSTGLRVFIQRSIPIQVQVDGQTLKTRTQGRSVGDALTEMGIGVAGLDQVEPPLESKLYDNTEIRIVRVTEDIEILQDIVPFETVYVPDPGVLIDTQQLVNPGAEGITRHRYRVRYEDGQEAERVLEDSWMAQEPAQRVIAYGQNIVPRTFTTANGPGDHLLALHPHVRHQLQRRHRRRLPGCALLWAYPHRRPHAGRRRGRGSQDHSLAQPALHPQLWLRRRPGHRLRHPRPAHRPGLFRRQPGPAPGLGRCLPALAAAAVVSDYVGDSELSRLAKVNG